MTNIATALASTSTTPTAPATPTATAGVSSLAAPTGFLQLFGQISGEAAKHAITPIDTAALASTADVAMEEEAGDATSMLIAGLPISLPMLQPEAKLQPGTALAGQVGALMGAKSASGNVGELQMVTDMIEGELALARDAQNTPESFQLPQVEQTAPKQTMVLDTQRSVHAPVGSSQWADELGSRLTLMTEQGKQAASLRLSPEHLGPLEIRIAITEERASVWFGAAHADTRAAIENALPRLREMFEAQGMSLADAGVYDQTPREQPEIARPSSLGAGESPEAEAKVTHVRVNLGLVDAYA